MGSKCGCGPKEEPWTQEQLDNIVKIQSSIRTSLAVKQRKELKNGKLEELFSKCLSLLMGLIIFLSSASILISYIAQDKKNHKGAETWMLTQRIGTLKLSEIMMDD
jgi:heme/copper-type cytochrome/quinol oxidase subunit 3